MTDDVLLYLLLAAALAGFISGVWRFDVVALLALLAAVMLKLVPAGEAFLGFGHPAVITVAAVLVVSRGLQSAGLVGLIGGVLERVGQNTAMQVAALTGTVAVLSSFINNVGALALLLPVAMGMARKSEKPPSLFLMPLAFGSLLGGLTTLIGTPPNLIVSGYRAARGGEPFGMFSFTPVGAAIAGVCVLFIAVAGWRLLPKRKSSTSAAEMFEVEKYLAELRVPAKSKAEGRTLAELAEMMDNPPPVIGVVRGGKVRTPYTFRGVLQKDDVLLVEGETDELEGLAAAVELEPGAAGDDAAHYLEGGELRLVEAVVQMDSFLVGRTADAVRLLPRHGLNLLAVARQGQRLRQRLGKVRFRGGDVLLLQGQDAGLSERLSHINCLPLASRELRIGLPRRLSLAMVLFAAGIVAVVAGWAPASVALSAVALAMVLFNVLPLREAYTALDLPVLVLLAALIPVGEAIETTGAAENLVNLMLGWGAAWPPVMSLAAMLLVTMVLSDIINNAATAVLMAPIAWQLAEGLRVSPDPFLMAVAVGASCAFLTPIGHQSNTLVMGPGGYRFSDYWRLGLPVQAFVFMVALPMILLVWPW